MNNRLIDTQSVMAYLRSLPVLKIFVVTFFLITPFIIIGGLISFINTVTQPLTITVSSTPEDRPQSIDELSIQPCQLLDDTGIKEILGVHENSIIRKDSMINLIPLQEENPNLVFSCVIQGLHEDNGAGERNSLVISMQQTVSGGNEITAVNNLKEIVLSNNIPAKKSIGTDEVVFECQEYLISTRVTITNREGLELLNNQIMDASHRIAQSYC